MLRRTDPHLPSKKSPVLVSHPSMSPPQPLHDLPLSLPPVLEKAAKIPCFTSGPQQPATELAGRARKTYRAGLQVRSSPLSHRHPCSTQPWPETGRQGFPRGRGSMVSVVSGPDTVSYTVSLYRPSAMWTDGRSAGWAALAECGMGWNVPRDDSGAIGWRPPTE